MDQLIPEMIDHICKYLTIKNMYIFMQSNRYIYNTITNNIYFKTIKHYDIVFIFECLTKISKNECQILEYLLTNYKFTKKNLKRAFQHACQKGYLDIVKALFEKKR